jgi:hypothetical protein
MKINFILNLERDIYGPKILSDDVVPHVEIRIFQTALHRKQEEPQL